MNEVLVGLTLPMALRTAITVPTSHPHPDTFTFTR